MNQRTGIGARVRRPHRTDAVEPPGRAKARKFASAAGRTPQPPTRDSLEIGPASPLGWRQARAVVSGQLSAVSWQLSVVSGQLSVVGERDDLDVPESPTPTATPSYQCNTPAFRPRFNTV
jgi:hypothetical protein